MILTCFVGGLASLNSSPRNPPSALESEMCYLVKKQVLSSAVIGGDLYCSPHRCYPRIPARILGGLAGLERKKN